MAHRTIHFPACRTRYKSDKLTTPTGLERYHVMIRIILAFAVFTAASTTVAETLHFSSFRIEMESGWVHEVESGAATQNSFGPKISIYSPDGHSALTIRTMDAPNDVSAEALTKIILA